MAGASYLTRVARRAAKSAPALMPPSALLMRWQMAQTLPEPEPSFAPGEPAKSATRRVEPVSARPASKNTESVAVPAASAQPPDATRHTVPSPPRANVPGASVPRADSPPSVAAMAVLERASARTQRSMSDALPSAIASSPPRGAPVRSEPTQTKQSVDRESPMPKQAPVPATPVVVGIERLAARSLSANVAQSPGEAFQHRPEPKRSELTPPPPAVSPAQAAPPIAVLMPPAPPERLPVGPPPKPEEQAPKQSTIRIGSVEVQIVQALPASTVAARPAAAPPPRASLSRDLTSMYGLRQG